MMIEFYNENTKTLIIPEYFNEELNDVTKETKIIIFENNYDNYKNFNGNIISKFNQPVNKLPEKITHLTFRCNFNQKVDNLPLSLTHLTFGRQTPVRLAHPKIMNIFIIV